MEQIKEIMIISGSNFVIKKKGVLKDDSLGCQIFYILPLYVISASWGKDGSKCKCSVCYEAM
jgi:hypothetical protein